MVKISKGIDQIRDERIRIEPQRIGIQSRQRLCHLR